MGQTDTRTDGRTVCNACTVCNDVHKTTYIQRKNVTAVHLNYLVSFIHRHTDSEKVCQVVLRVCFSSVWQDGHATIAPGDTERRGIVEQSVSQSLSICTFWPHVKIIPWSGRVGKPRRYSWCGRLLWRLLLHILAVQLQAWCWYADECWRHVENVAHINNHHDSYSCRRYY